jgi:hypothetical protein
MAKLRGMQKKRSGLCQFCGSQRHQLKDCPNIDPEQAKLAAMTRSQRSQYKLSRRAKARGESEVVRRISFPRSPEWKNPHCRQCGIKLKPSEGFQGLCSFCVREGPGRTNPGRYVVYDFKLGKPVTGVLPQGQAMRQRDALNAKDSPARSEQYRRLPSYEKAGFELRYGLVSPKDARSNPMKFMTKEDLRRLPPLYSQEKKGDQAKNP